MTLNSKWILAASADDPVHDVAVRTIEARLTAVRHHLPLAAEKPDENVEHVHQLRVATRRSVAALDMYRKLFPKEPRKALCRELKAVRRAAGRARDYDVLLLRQTPNSEDPLARQFQDDIRRRRGEAQIPLREIQASLAATHALDSLTQQMYAVADSDVVAGGSPLFGPWARKQLRKSVKAFFAAEPRQLNDLEALHTFRIRGKELRYAMELLVTAFPASFHTRLYPLIERLQDRLGPSTTTPSRSNDFATGARRPSTRHSPSRNICKRW